MSEEFEYDVFLSHSSKDKPVVRPLAERLKADGLRVWFDEWQIEPGDSIPAKIEEGLERSRVLLFCMSANAFGTDWPQLEAHTFRFRDPLNKGRRFIPVRLDDARIKGSLAQFRYIKWTAGTREEEYEKLLAACRPQGRWPAKKSPHVRRQQAERISQRVPRRRAALRGLKRLHADGLDRRDVRRAIREFHRAIWDYRDSLEWLHHLKTPRSAKTPKADRDRAAIREYCGSRNVSAWQQAAATLPIILRAGEHLGIPCDRFRKAIARSPRSPESLNGVEALVRRVEAHLRAVPRAK